MVSELKPISNGDVTKYLSCIHCGLCTSACPTYMELGSEPDSPRGRIHLMRAIAEGRLEWEEEVVTHLDACLDCQACVTACPSGVEYGRLIEDVKIELEAGKHRPRKNRMLISILRDRLFPFPARLRAALLPLKLLKLMGVSERVLEDLAYHLPHPFSRLVDLVPPELLRKRGQPLPRVVRAEGEEKHRVALLTGCVGSALFHHVNEATVKVLVRHGCTVIIPPEQQCCGALHHHTGAVDGARQFARHNLEAFPVDDVDAIIVNAAGCGSTLKDYGHLLADDPRQAQADTFSTKVRDITEFLADLDLNFNTDVVETMQVTYHDACHLAHGQKVTREPRELLKQIPGLKLIPLTESDTCCGSAGIYNITHPEMADQLQARKVDHIVDTGAWIVATGNSGCTLQIVAGLRKRGLDIQVMHPVEIIERATRMLSR